MGRNFDDGRKETLLKAVAARLDSAAGGLIHGLLQTSWLRWILDSATRGLLQGVLQNLNRAVWQMEL
ncbi:hypothetical protein ACHQM5_001032 [Ranunculus cassubicifolius]